MIRLARDTIANGGAGQFSSREQDLRNFLGTFNFSGDMVKQAVGTMSGGEKARLVLCMIVWQRPNLLLLDEPTNHLDLATREALAMALERIRRHRDAGQPRPRPAAIRVRRVLAGHARRRRAVRRRPGRLPALSAGRGQARARKPEGGRQAGRSAQAGNLRRWRSKKPLSDKSLGGKLKSVEAVAGEARQEHGCAAWRIQLEAAFGRHPPALYWGKSSYTGRPPILQMGARLDAQGKPMGVTRVYGREFNTTGVLGVSAGRGDQPVQRGFPAWLTLPSQQWLAMGRRWHFFFAWVLVINGLAYIAYTLASRHLTRDLMPTRADWRSIGPSIKDHLLLRHARGEAARRYNILQKLTYLGVIFVLFPLADRDGLGHVAGAECAFPGLGRPVRRPPVGTHAPLRAGVAAGGICVHPSVRGRHQRPLEQPALDDHGALPDCRRGERT
jgi:thiosulfate reductase cytochrome b subunit